MDAWALNGALVDVLEYYLYAKHIKKDICLIFLENPDFFDVRSTIRDIIQDRYTINFDWEQDVHYWKSKSQLPSTKFKNILIFDYTTLEHVPIMCGEKIHIFYDHEPDKIKLYKILNAHNHIEIYNEMPFGIGKPYRMKFAFDLYKKIEGYVAGHSFVDKKEDRILKDHKKGLFDFDVYEYIHDGTFDRRPRMMIESYYYGKNVKYTNETGIKDGSYYRFQDLRKNGLSNRNLTPKDEIMRLL